MCDKAAGRCVCRCGDTTEMVPSVSQADKLAQQRGKNKSATQLAKEGKKKGHRKFDPEAPYAPSVGGSEKKGALLLRIEAYKPALCKDFRRICHELVWDDAKVHHHEVRVPSKVRAFRKKFNLPMSGCWQLKDGHDFGVSIRDISGYAIGSQPCRTRDGTNSCVPIKLHALALSDGGRKPYVGQAAHLCGNGRCFNPEHMEAKSGRDNIASVNCSVGYAYEYPAEPGVVPRVDLRYTCDHHCIPTHVDKYDRFAVTNGRYRYEMRAAALANEYYDCEDDDDDTDEDDDVEEDGGDDDEAGEDGGDDDADEEGDADDDADE